jgi:hypothetical protein
MPNALPSPIHTLMWNADRSSTRRKVGKGSTLRGEDGAPRDVVLEDLSLSGFRISGHDRLSPGDEIAVGLAGVGVREATVIWSDDRGAGCEFLKPITPVDVDNTLSANTVVRGDFTWSRNIGQTNSAEQSAPRRLSYRRRLAIIGVGAVGTWAILIEAARLAMSLVW